MVDDLLRALSEFKANMEYRNVDFNADKNKQYEAVRKAMARKYSSGDVDLFGPEETTAIPEDVEESLRKELVEKVMSKKALMKKSYSRVMEKIKELRQKFCNAVTAGSKSGSGKLVMEFYDVMVKIWGGSPSTEPLSFGVQSSVLHDHEKQLGEASDTSSDLSFQADQSPQGGETSSDQSRSLKRPRSSSPVVQLIHNKRKHMERQLSSAKRDQILIDEEREDNKSRKDLAESMLQSNQVFAQSMQAVSSSMMCIAQTMSRSFEMLAHALALPEQGMTQPSHIAVPFMSLSPRPLFGLTATAIQAWAENNGVELETRNFRKELGQEMLKLHSTQWTAGFMHMPHSEDIPNTATAANSASFYLRPYNFLDEDPSMSSHDAVFISRTENGDFDINRFGTPEGPACAAKISTYSTTTTAGMNTHKVEKVNELFKSLNVTFYFLDMDLLGNVLRMAFTSHVGITLLFLCPRTPWTNASHHVLLKKGNIHMNKRERSENIDGKTKGCLPIKWTAPEILLGNLDGISTLSDVHDIMKRCWNFNPDLSPPLESLRQRMDKYIREETYEELLNLGASDKKKYSRVEDLGEEDAGSGEEVAKNAAAKRLGKWSSPRR
ncbi:Membrane primary amine oxidase [Stylophora pistillata]|uniref:Membrane primary amine oxidase n=1 Tax=Stylophora pistillata TaxID=50429 RepID=A0A2B4RWQ6_STYPI|nr:Membrane primary amine oxidase [Stylophora pistillata]